MCRPNKAADATLIHMATCLPLYTCLPTEYIYICASNMRPRASQGLLRRVSTIHINAERYTTYTSTKKASTFDLEIRGSQASQIRDLAPYINSKKRSRCPSLALSAMPSYRIVVEQIWTWAEPPVLLFHDFIQD